MQGCGAKLAEVDSAPTMHIRPALFAIVAACLVAVPAMAQLPSEPTSPYAPVAVTLPAPAADPSFAAFRTAIAAAAKSRIYADLEALVQPQGFFWDRDFGNGFDPKKPSVDNLAMAIELERGDGMGWEKLARFAEEKAFEPLDSRPGIVCAPARPAYDAVELSKLLNATYTTAADWAYPLADGVPVRGAPRANAPAIGRLALQFVRHLGLQRAEDTNAAGTPWAKVALPDGKTGYVEPGHLSSLAVERLCYVKDMVVGWRITGFIGGGS
jgi:hypothetical protein